MSYDEDQEFSYKELEPVLNKYVNFAIPLYIEMLEKHKYNLHKYRKFFDYNRINKELINSRTTVLQLKYELVELDNLKYKVIDKDYQLYETKVSATKQNALKALAMFDEFLYVLNSLNPTNMSNQSNQINDSNGINDMSKSEYTLNADEISKAQAMHLITQSMIEKPGILGDDSLDDFEAVLRQNAQQLQTLHNDLDDVNYIFRHLATIVESSGEKIDAIETKVEDATQTTTRGIRNLSQALKFKGTLYPIMGAALGTAIGGPVGLYCGLKVGTLVALGGAVVGSQGGVLIKRVILKRREKNTAMTTQILSQTPDKDDKKKNDKQEKETKEPGGGNPFIIDPDIPSDTKELVEKTKGKDWKSVFSFGRKKNSSNADGSKQLTINNKLHEE